MMTLRNSLTQTAAIAVLMAGFYTAAAVQIFGQAYPPRPPAPADVLERGEALYQLECGFCHGEDARGGDMASNLLRSGVVLNDQNGELLGELLAEGIPAEQMPSFDFSQRQVEDLAGYLHSFRVNGYDISRQRPMSIVVGDAQAGEVYFTANCQSCHNDRDEVAAFVRTNNDPQNMQQRWMMPGGRGAPATPVTVTVALDSGQTIEGELERIDDFLVSLTDASGRRRSFRRSGNSPRVDIHDPLAAHKELLPSYSDEDIHNVTAYLITLQ